MKSVVSPSSKPKVMGGAATGAGDASRECAFDFPARGKGKAFSQV
jgi:hypothetical protein